MAAIVALWHEVANSDHTSVFKQAPQAARKRNAFDKIPQPGFVGPHYRPGGMLFMGKNPGNDPGAELSPPDTAQLRLIDAFIKSRPEKLRAAFDDLMEGLLHSVMPHWLIVRVLVNPVLDSVSRSLSEVAYLNMVKFHTESTNLPKSLFDQSWPQTAAQLTLLDPAVIVVLGLSTAKAFFPRYTGQARNYVFPRSNGDKYLENRAKGLITDFAQKEKAKLAAAYSLLDA